MKDTDDKDKENTIEKHMEEKAQDYITNKIAWFSQEDNVRSVFLDGARYGYSLGYRQAVKNLNLAQKNGKKDRAVLEDK